jgi:hemoglobin-like flavoprotein
MTDRSQSVALLHVSAPDLGPDALRRIRARYDQIRPADFCRVFFDRLFARMPDVRPLMPSDLASHGEFVEAAIAIVVRNLADLEALERPLEELGAEHARHGIGPDWLRTGHAVLMETLRELTGNRWSPSEERDWSVAFAALLAPMIGAPHG